MTFVTFNKLTEWKRVISIYFKMIRNIMINLRQAHRSALHWDRIHDELWLKSNQVTQPRSFQPMSQGRVPGKVNTTPKGYCFRFHKGRKCAPGCAYKHQCYKCEGSHPVSNCNFRGQSKQSSFHPSTARSQSSHPANTSKSWKIKFFTWWVHPFHCWVSYIWFYELLSNSFSRCAPVAQS